MNKQIVLLVLVTVALAACGTAPKQKVKPAPIVDLIPKQSVDVPQAAPEVAHEAAPAPAGSGGYLAGDGPGADAPANLDTVPDAVPKAEPLHRYANREYTALGKTYKPLEAPCHYKEVGIASWYGKKFHGQRTSTGEVYDMYSMSAAHTTLPVPSYARVTNVATKKSVIVRVNDRGPFLHDRIIDLSYTAAYKLGIINNGSAEVEVECVAPDSPEVSLIPAPVKSEPLPVEAAPPVAQVPAPAVAAAVVGKAYLQLGAFKSQQGAKKFLAKMRTKLGKGAKPLSLFTKDGLERVHLGPYASQDEARAAGEQLKARLGFKPYISMR